MFDYELEHILSFVGKGGGTPEAIGALPDGLHVNFQNVGGEVTGPRIRGKVRPTGGDWVTVRKDGVAILDARITLETDDHALILVTYSGIVDFGPDGYERFQRGELPPVARIRTSPRFFTSHAEYLWLNRLHCLGIGEYRPAARTASYEVYAVR